MKLIKGERDYELLEVNGEVETILKDGSRTTLPIEIVEATIDTYDRKESDIQGFIKVGASYFRIKDHE